jgi:hypothetical protein
MKIKIDYVTNSSSTSYVVCIPPHYKFQHNEVRKEIANLYGEDESDDTIENLANEVLSNLEEAQSSRYGAIFIEEYCDNINSIIEAIPWEYIIATFESPQGSGRIMFIRPDDLERFLVERWVQGSCMERQVKLKEDKSG